MVVVVFVACGALVGCGGSAKQGGEREACYPNGTCNTGLSCLSNVCVSAGDAGGSGGASGGGGTGGSGVGCLLAANYGTIGATTPAAIRTDYLDWSLPLEPGSPPRDEFNLQMFDGLGVFGAGLATGTYTLTGDELNYSTCGLCVLIHENIDVDTSYRGVYIATAGTVTLSSVNGTLSGNATDLTFRHVVIDQDTTVSAPHADGCRSAIDSISFTVPIN